MPSLWHSAPFVIVLVIIGEFFWLDATPSNYENNVWTRRQNSTINANNNAEWQGPPTTPWPALGARRPYNHHSNTNKPNQNVQNRNVNAGSNLNEGVLLSYGTGGNVGQNRGSNKGISSGNIGVDLSYGTGGNSQNNLGSKQARNPTSSVQNVNSANTGQSYATVMQRQNSNKPTDPKTRQNSRIQSSTTNINNVHQPGTNVGSALQPRDQTKAAVDEDEELREFSEALLRKDVNNAGKYVTINFQGKTTSRSTVDQAPLPLLTIQKEAYDIPSIANLLALHNNYILETNVNEHVSAQEKIEENTLLDSLLSTSVMQHTRNFLIQKGVIDKDPKSFKNILKEIWFNMYSRGKGKIGSSGFEHVFLAEIKGQDISGLHNWLYFHDAEAKNSANYLGYLKKIELTGNKGAILKYHFVLDGKDKPVGSMFIGTSPELEIALYSTCFLLRADQVCPLRLDGKKFIIRTYTFRYRGKDMIGSAFPEI